MIPPTTVPTGPPTAVPIAAPAAPAPAAPTPTPIGCAPGSPVIGSGLLSLVLSVVVVFLLICFTLRLSLLLKKLPAAASVALVADHLRRRHGERAHDHGISQRFKKPRFFRDSLL